MKVLFSVTQAHIDAGRRCQGDNCPIVFALRELGFHDLHVNGNWVRFRHINYRATWAPLSIRAQRFSNNFDRKGKSAVTPSKFQLTIL